MSQNDITRIILKEDNSAIMGALAKDNQFEVANSGSPHPVRLDGNAKPIALVRSRSVGYIRPHAEAHFELTNLFVATDTVAEIQPSTVSYNEYKGRYPKLVRQTKIFLNKPHFFSIMKLPKIMKRYCPKCKKHTEHKVGQTKKKNPRSLTYGSKVRAKRRGRARGLGNRGRYSKPAISKFKMTGKKSSKKTDLRYECKVCKKTHMQKQGFRAKKVEFK